MCSPSHFLLRFMAERPRNIPRDCAASHGCAVFKGYRTPWDGFVMMCERRGIGSS